MNYRIFLAGHRFQTYHDCIKLLTYSASQSDYVVDIEGFEKNTPSSPLKNHILLKGSSKNIYSDIVIDFDDLVFIISILNSNYFSFDLVKKTLKNKKHFLFSSEEELLTYLLDKEICLESSNRIIADLGHLFEWEILLLESSDMNEDEIEVIKNIKSLSKENSSLNEASCIYLLAYFKYYYPNQFSNCL